MTTAKPFQVGSKAGRFARTSGGFTLIELILVMALIVIAISITGPMLSDFFKGRTLDAEARRFVALTRYGQSRAVSEGVPMVLWIDDKQRTYGLEIEAGYVEEDTGAKEFELEEGLEIEVVRSTIATATVVRNASANQLQIRFTPDAFLADSNPDAVILRDAKKNESWIMPNRNNLGYEVRTNNLQTARR